MSADRSPSDAGSGTSAAVEFARTAVLDGETAGTRSGVGPHLSTQSDASGLTVVEFESLLPAYPGWRWTVVLATDETGSPSVCDVVLLPGEDALVAPRWVPWRERLLPGDLGPGDLLPADPNDARLVPGYTGEDDDSDVVDAVWELGLGRERVLSAHGRDVAVERWLEGSTGPKSADAKLAPHPCASCGFFVGIKGRFNLEFGVCANEFSPVDGRVVSVGYGCGAHSGVVVAPTQEATATLDEFDYQALDLRADDGPDGDGEVREDVASEVDALAGTDAAADTHETADSVDGDGEVKADVAFGVGALADTDDAAHSAEGDGDVLAGNSPGVDLVRDADDVAEHGVAGAGAGAVDDKEDAADFGDADGDFRLGVAASADPAADADEPASEGDGDARQDERSGHLGNWQ